MSALSFGMLTLCLVSYVSGALYAYKIATPVNEATLRVGRVCFSSNLPKPHLLDFVNYSDDRGTRLTYRLCGLPGDTVEIRNGVLYVNQKEMDGSLHLSRSYRMTSEEERRLSAKYHLKGINEENPRVFTMENDTVTVILDQLTARAQGINQFYYLPKSDSNEAIEAAFHHPWNRDQFGPLVIPAHLFFVLGDNRDQSLDSRYEGLIPEIRIRGILL